MVNRIFDILKDKVIDNNRELIIDSNLEDNIIITGDFEKYKVNSSPWLLLSSKGLSEKEKMEKKKKYVENNPLIIKNNYKYLDLSKLKCRKINYENQDNNQIEKHKLPNTLEELRLDRNNNNIYKLPNLPESLTFLHCNSIGLRELPRLPNNLIKLFCQSNELKELPELPNNLIELYCNRNKIKNLPPIPENLRVLEVFGNEVN